MKKHYQTNSLDHFLDVWRQDTHSILQDDRVVGIEFLGEVSRSWSPSVLGARFAGSFYFRQNPSEPGSEKRDKSHLQRPTQMTLMKSEQK
jgi:hypothetical protein